MGITDFINYGHIPGIPFYPNRTGQGIAVDAFQFDLGYSLHLKVKFYAAANSAEIQRIGDRTGHRYGGFCIVAVASRRLCGRNGYGYAFAVRNYHIVCRIGTIQRVVIGKRAFDGAGKS